MATTRALFVQQKLREESPEQYAGQTAFVATALTIAAVLIHGFHPYAEDGGIYMPGVIKILHPELYPSFTAFVTAQGRFSFFPAAMATLVRVTGLSLLTCIFCVYVASIWATLYAASELISRCSTSSTARYSGVLVLALCLTMPIAGTSVLLVDPYVTARTISTPCGLFAILGSVDALLAFNRHGVVRTRSIALCVVSLLIAANMHPLMAAYAVGCVLLLACASLESTGAKLTAFGIVALLCFAGSAVFYWIPRGEPSGYAQVAQTRNYWFLGAWHGYEVMGLIAPLVLLAGMARMRVVSGPARWLAEMAIVAGGIGLSTSLFFAHEVSRSYIIAMLQPLRIFQMIYVVFLLLAGTVLGDRLLKRIAWRWVAFSILLGGLMAFVQIQTYPYSAHLELPWSEPSNNWERGFQWIREHTSKDAVFAIDANYINEEAEDTHNFRAAAERSVLPDHSKDGGIAAIEPDLTLDWMYGERVQTGLNADDDEKRKSKLAAAKISWLVLTHDARTNFPCPYKNGSMKVCRVP